MILKSDLTINSYGLYIIFTLLYIIHNGCGFYNLKKNNKYAEAKDINSIVNSINNTKNSDYIRINSIYSIASIKIDKQSKIEYILEECNKWIQDYNWGIRLYTVKIIKKYGKSHHFNILKSHLKVEKEKNVINEINNTLST